MRIALYRKPSRIPARLARVEDAVQVIKPAAVLTPSKRGLRRETNPRKLCATIVQMTGLVSRHKKESLTTALEWWLKHRDVPLPNTLEVWRSLLIKHGQRCSPRLVSRIARLTRQIIPQEET